MCGASAELQAAVAQQWHEFKVDGSGRSRDAIVEHYRYLITITRQRILPTVPIKILAEDMDQEGLIALVKAVDHFDPKRKVKFESYAISMVRGAMLEYLRREDWVPRSVRTKQKILHAAQEAVALRKGPQNVRDVDIADYLDMPIDAFYQLYYEASVVQVLSLEDPVGDSEHDTFDPLLVLESVKSNCDDPHTTMEVLNQRELLQQCFRWLPPVERLVLVLYYYEGYTLKQIAMHLRRSESRAHQLHYQGLHRLSRHLARQRGLFFPSAVSSEIREAEVRAQELVGAGA